MNVSLVSASGTVRHVAEIHGGVELVRNGSPFTGRYVAVTWEWSHQAFRWSLVKWVVTRQHMSSTAIRGRNWSDLPEALHDMVRDMRPMSLTK